MTPARRSRRRTAVVLLALTASLVLAGCQISGTHHRTNHSREHHEHLGILHSRRRRSGPDPRHQDGPAGHEFGIPEKGGVRVTEDSYGPEINTRDSGKIALTIAAPNGEITGETDRIRFNTTDKRPDFSEVTYFLTAGSADEYFTLIRDGVQRYGISSDSAERWISSTEKNPAKKSDFSITSGTSVGPGRELRPPVRRRQGHPGDHRPRPPGTD